MTKQCTTANTQYRETFYGDIQYNVTSLLTYEPSRLIQCSTYKERFSEQIKRANKVENVHLRNLQAIIKTL